MLALGNDADLKSLATRDLRQPDDGPSRLALGDAWYDLAQKQEPTQRPRLLARAGYWYELGQVGLTGLTKTRVEKRLTEINAATTPFQSGTWVELLDFVDLKRDVRRGQMVWRSGALVVPKHEASSTLVLPVSVNGSYELRYRATKFTATEDLITVSLPFPKHHSMVAISGGSGATGIWKIRGRGGDDDANPAKAPAVASFRANRPYTVDLKVTLGDGTLSVAASADGRKCLSYQGPLDDFGEEEHWGAEAVGPKMLLGFWHGRQTMIHSVQFKLISGTARLVE